LKNVTKLGTIVTEMGTTREDRISSALFGKMRRSVLGLLYSHPDEAFYMRQIAEALQAGVGALQRELERLTGAGVIKRSRRGRHVYYQANELCPVYPELRSLIVKTAGVMDVLRNALASLENRISVAFVFGSVARAREGLGSDIDLFVIGDVSFSEVVDVLAPAQERLRREINPNVYPVSEFSSKVGSGHHFVNAILKTDKIYLMGDKDEFERLAAKRLAD